MRLLITTQAVDKTHPNLSLFHRWIEEFAKHCESVDVICLYEGPHSLPGNVRVYSLGKEHGVVSRAVYAMRFFKTLSRVRKYDAVFVHMNPEYVVLAGWWWRLTGKKIALWYTHKSVTATLRMAVFFVTRIFTASRESFRIQSPKVRVVGHGIDTERFRWDGIQKSGLNIATVGRISPTKQIVEMLDALEVLHQGGTPFTFSIAGGPLMEQDSVYEQKVKKNIETRTFFPSIRMDGVVSYDNLPQWLSDKSVFLNLSLTGSVDRAVLEAAAMGVVPVSTNEAFQDMLAPYGLYVESNPKSIADGIIRASHTDPASLADYVRREHAIATLILKILADI